MAVISHLKSEGEQTTPAKSEEGLGKLRSGEKKKKDISRDDDPAAGRGGSRGKKGWANKICVTRRKMGPFFIPKILPYLES